MKNKWESICVVDKEWGTIAPAFKIGREITSGKLKYLGSLKGKK